MSVGINDREDECPVMPNDRIQSSNDSSSSSSGCCGSIVADVRSTIAADTRRRRPIIYSKT